MLKEIGFGRAT